MFHILKSSAFRNTSGPKGFRTGTGDVYYYSTQDKVTLLGKSRTALGTKQLNSQARAMTHCASITHPLVILRKTPPHPTPPRRPHLVFSSIKWGAWTRSAGFKCGLKPIGPSFKDTLRKSVTAPVSMFAAGFLNSTV